MPVSDPDPTSSATRRTASAQVRRFGVFALHTLLGRSSLTMAWQAHDTRTRQGVLLMLPRQAPADADALAATLDAMRRASRIDHPSLLVPMAQGQHDHWPYLACDIPPGAATLQAHLAQHPGAPLLEIAGWCIDILEAVAALHDGGLSHGDIGLHSVLIDRTGRALLWGAGLADAIPDDAGTALEPGSLRLQREAGERDLQAIGLVLYRLVAQAHALDEPDLPTAGRRLGRDIVRLPWALPQPVPEALRAIVNRAVDRHAQRRYLGARSLERALSGWRQVQSADRGGPLALVVDRLRSVGHLPARPRLAERIQEIARMQTQRLDDLADVILQDPALSFELLRTVNAVQFGRASEGGVGTVRRAVQLIGVNGVRRAAASLRAWPGPLAESGQQALDRAIKRACLAGHVAEFLAPAGLDAEGALLAAQLQHLGRLLVRYHFPDEAAQIAVLMQPTAAKEGEAATPGLSEDAAAMAVLGVDLPSLAHAVARHWGLNEAMQAMMMPLSPQQSVHTPTAADAWVRAVASCANETVEALLQAQSTARTRQLLKVASRYAKALGTTPDSLKEVFALARQKLEAHLDRRPD